MTFKETYKDIIDDLQPSQDFTERLLKSEEGRLMKFNKRKKVVLVAVACMVMGTTVFAAGRIASYRSSSDPGKEMYSYSEAASKTEELGSELTIPETFSNGYAFKSANTMDVEGIDDNGNKVARSTDFTANYVKEGNEPVYMFINRAFEDDEKPYVIDEKSINGINVCLNHASYKFVPEGYELTDEDVKNMEDSHYELSYGTPEIIEQNYDGISFELNGKSYSMFSWDSNLTADEWYEMAEDWLNQ